MANKITLTAEDGHELDAWRADPNSGTKGGVIILQAIYGLTSHLGDVCDMYAARGYAAIAPAMYDRTGKNQVFGYDGEGRDKAFEHRSTLADETVRKDVSACVAALRRSFSDRPDGPGGKVAISGFCTGGTWAWTMAAGLGGLDAAVIFYGSDLYELRNLKPRCPTLLHYGDSDHIVPMDHVNEIHALHPDLPLEIYPGQGHAFFNPEQNPDSAEAAALAFENTIGFLDAQFG
jgi:carboxymethylenebutenolidase